MKKKLFAILAVLVLSSMILAACGTPAPATEAPAVEEPRCCRMHSEGSQEDRVLCIRPEQRIPPRTGY